MFPAVRYWSSLFIVSQGTINCNSDRCGCIEKHIHFSHPVSTWQKRGRGKKEHGGWNGRTLCRGGMPPARNLLRYTGVSDSISWVLWRLRGYWWPGGRNKARAILEEPVAAVVTFMGHEEGFCSRETVHGQTTAVTEHTAAGLAAVKRTYLYFFHGPRTVLCWINKYSVFSSFS